MKRTMAAIRVNLLILIMATLTFSPSFAEDIDSTLGPAPGTYKITSPDGVVRIPFELYRGDIRFDGEINGKKVRMLIDNGFLWDQLLFWGSPSVDSLGFNYQGKEDVGGSGEGDHVASDLAQGITISFPGLEFYDQTALIMPYSGGFSTMWSGSEGQISATFFKHFVVDVNFDSMILTLIEPEKFTYTGGGEAVPLIPNGDGSWAIPAAVEFTNGEIKELNITLDLGYGDALEVTTVGPNKIPMPENVFEGSLGFGVQGETRGFYGRVDKIEIAGYTLDQVITAFVAPEYAENVFHESWLGLDLLSRFNFVFDYPHHMMYFEPNQTFNEPFEYNMSGMAMRKGQGDFLEITKVFPDSPAKEAGLKAGDRVLVIDGRPAIDYDVWELRPILRKEGTTLSMTVMRDSTEMKVSLKLRRLL